VARGRTPGGLGFNAIRVDALETSWPGWEALLVQRQTCVTSLQVNILLIQQIFILLQARW
jgi:hypothetical protein